MRPLVAVNAELEGGAGEERLALSLRYVAALERAGARPLVVAPLSDESALRELVAGLDGVLLSGADDFDTERLGLGPTHAEAKPVPHAKQDFDARLVRAALAAEVPVLGICYGMQLLGLVGGGRLHQHLPDDLPEAREHRGGVLHDVRFEPGTKLGALAAVERASVVSRHHQALASVGEDWVVAARDDEGLIEAVEHRRLAFAVGVQWHPELGGSTADEAILAGLVAASLARRNARRETPQGAIA